MSIKSIIKRLFGRGGNSEQAELEHLIKNGLKLGTNVRNYSPFGIDSEWSWLISIGDNTMISTDVRILAHDASTGFLGIGTKIGRVEIGKNCFIGCGTIVLCDTKIGDNVIVGAGSVVTKDLDSNAVYAGAPARFICTIEQLKRKHINSGVTFDKYSWNQWKNAPLKDKEDMYIKCRDSHGYVK